VKAKALLLLQGLAIVLAGWFVFAPAIHGGWLWDDGLEVTKNPVLRDPAGIWKIWFAPTGLDYFPLKTTVQWVQWHLWGMRTTGYHLTAIGLHLLGALLLWRLLAQLGVRLAWVGGLLFAVHPLAVESVAWIAELKNVLSLPLVLGAMMVWVSGDHARPDSSMGPIGRIRLISLALFIAAMLCKSSVVMFPFVLLLYAWWKRGRIARADILASAPFFVVSLVLGVIAVVFQNQRAITGFGVPLGGFLSRLAAAGLAIAFYATKCVVPVGMLPIYPQWKVDPPALVQFLPWAAVAGLVFWLVREARSGRSWPRHVLFGLGFFLLNLVPVLGFVPIAYLRIAPVADHFAYLSLAGMVGLAAAGLGALAQPHFGIGPIGPMLIMVTLAALALDSRRYAAVFQSEKTLWAYTVQRNPRAWLAYNNLGIALRAEGKRQEAVADYEASLRLSPGFAEAHNNLGVALAEMGRQPEAIAQYREAIRLNPKFADPYNNLGNLLFRAGRLAEAQSCLETALRLNPDYPEAHNNLGELLIRTGHADEAIVHLQRALGFRPDFPEAENNLGAALASKGRLPEAISHYEAALQLAPDFAEAHNNLGLALAASHRLPEAVRHYEQALRLDPNLTQTHYNLGLALRAEGRMDEASEQFKEAK